MRAPPLSRPISHAGAILYGLGATNAWYPDGCCFACDSGMLIGTFLQFIRGTMSLMINHGRYLRLIKIKIIL